MEPRSDLGKVGPVLLPYSSGLEYFLCAGRCSFRLWAIALAPLPSNEPNTGTSKEPYHSRSDDQRARTRAASRSRGRGKGSGTMAVLVTVVLEGSPLFLRVRPLRASLLLSPLCVEIFFAILCFFAFVFVCLLVGCRTSTRSRSLSVRCLRSIPHARKPRVRAKER